QKAKPAPVMGAITASESARWPAESFRRGAALASGPLCCHHLIRYSRTKIGKRARPENLTAAATPSVNPATAKSRHRLLERKAAQAITARNKKHMIGRSVVT